MIAISMNKGATHSPMKRSVLPFSTRLRSILGCLITSTVLMLADATTDIFVTDGAGVMLITVEVGLIVVLD